MHAPRTFANAAFLCRHPPVRPILDQPGGQALNAPAALDPRLDFYKKCRPCY
jgi:hypothetical protein